MINKEELLLDLIEIFLREVTFRTCDEISIKHLSEEKQKYIYENVLEYSEMERDPNYISSPMISYYIQDQLKLLIEKCNFLQTVCQQMNDITVYNHELIKAPELKQWLIDNKK